MRLRPHHVLLLCITLSSAFAIPPSFPMIRLKKSEPPKHAPLVSMRGGAEGAGKGEVAKAYEPEEKDQSAQAMAFFNSERIPAALITGASLGVLFAFPLKHGEGYALGFMKRLYITLCCSAFCHELVAVFASSLAIAALLQLKHNPIGKSPAQMLLRECPLYFMAVRAHFLTGVLCFAGALAIRMYTDYHVGCSRFARAMLCLLAASCCYMVSLFNTSLVHFDNLGHLWWEYLMTIIKEIGIRKPGPIGLLTICLAGFATYEIVYVLGLFALLASGLVGAKEAPLPK
mmetsp:Transcript_30382/g.76401  ORF Transcript_30382/g.76401 Transcript_30382/m.76401 type:complete len:287 (+) Transcript_30382:35-895(+)